MPSIALGRPPGEWRGRLLPTRRPRQRGRDTSTAGRYWRRRWIRPGSGFSTAPRSSGPRPIKRITPGGDVPTLRRGTSGRRIGQAGSSCRMKRRGTKRRGSRIRKGRTRESRAQSRRSCRCASHHGPTHVLGRDLLKQLSTAQKMGQNHPDRHRGRSSSRSAVSMEHEPSRLDPVNNFTLLEWSQKDCGAAHA